MTQLLLGLGLSTLIGAAGYRTRSLSPSGVLGAVVVGTPIFGLGGLVWGGLLVLFFASSSALSHWRVAAKAAAAEKFAKGGRRDLAQALANGGLGALLAIGYWLHPHPLWLAAFVGAMAAVNADTWATEVGTLSPHPPRLITTLRPVPVGTSGGITLRGTIAALGGGVFIGLGAAALLWLTELSALSVPSDMAVYLARWPALLAIGGTAGLGSALLDSLLGATVQRLYICSVCGQTTERRLHCSRPSEPIGGWAWLDNDWVNFLASGAGAGIGVLVARVVAG